MYGASVAAKLAHEYDTRNPFELSQLLGAVVVRHPLVGIRGYYRHVDGVDFIVIADDLPDVVALFVCAHELGHHVLHKGLNRIFMDSRTFMEPNRLETSADRFAAQLLFGEPPLFQDETFTVWEMAEILNVPVCNVDSRLIELGIYH